MGTRIATLGAAYSANKGAASMVQALVDQLPARHADLTVDVLTTYPEADAAALARAQSPARAVPCRAVELVTVLVPLALVAGAVRALRLPWRWACRRPALDAIARADVVVDVSGISYSDSRKLRFTVYGFCLNLLPWLLGRPQVKSSQALGPFRNPVNRVLARVALPRLDSIAARGERTAAHLDAAAIAHVPAADLAFLMVTPDSARERVAALVPADEPTADALPWVGVAPSAVVDGFCRDQGIDYVGAVSDFVRTLVDGGRHRVVLFAHSTSTAELPPRLDDRPVCRAVHQRVARPDTCRFVDEDLLPTELRALEERCAIVVTSRFHAMVSALAVGTPTVVVGWSHKYGEVLAHFHQDDVVIDYGDLTGPGIAERFAKVDAERDVRSRQIRDGLDDVLASARRNLDEIDRVLDDTRGATR